MPGAGACAPAAGGSGWDWPPPSASPWSHGETPAGEGAVKDHVTVCRWNPLERPVSDGASDLVLCLSVALG